MTSRLLKVRQPGELEQLQMNHHFRRTLMEAYEKFYALHIQDFGEMRTISILREILG
jgi:DNA repair protein RecO (recombination protein O)